MNESLKPDSAAAAEPSSSHAATTHCRGGVHGRRAWRGFVLGLVVGVAGTLGASAWAQDATPEPMPPAPGMAWAGPGGMAGSPERIERMVDHMLVDVNATDVQRARVKEIAKAAAADLKPQREAAIKLRQQSMEAFTQPQVDAAQVERLRQQSMAAMDQVSRRTTQALLEISQVLTAEQRVKLAEQMKQRRHHRWHHRHHGPDHG